MYNNVITITLLYMWGFCALNNLKLDDDVLNIPLFMADQADRLIGLALEQRKAAGEC